MYLSSCDYSFVSSESADRVMRVHFDPMNPSRLPVVSPPLFHETTGVHGNPALVAVPPLPGKSLGTSLSVPIQLEC